MKNATMLYKAPGVHSIHGGQFDYIIVDADEPGAITNAKLDGWFESTPEAREAYENSISQPADNAPPTRRELEQKAYKLGIKFTNKLNDKMLGDMIASALAGK